MFSFSISRDEFSILFPINFSLSSENSTSIGSLSNSFVYSCCQDSQDSTSVASQYPSNSSYFYNYMVNQGFSDTIASDSHENKE